jgi:hypothetical protein
VRIDIARHRAGKHFARGRHRARRQRTLDPRADESHFVVEPDTALELELLDALLDLLADIVAALLENPELPLDTTLDDGLAEFE